MSRFRNNLYTVEAIVFRDHAHRYIRSDDGTLFSNDRKTKILVADLPEWYVYGRYHKRFGYMSTKGITDLRYVPNKFTNHYLKDDSLYVAYGGKIEDAPLPNTGAFYDRLIGYDDIVWGGEIISVLRGAQIYSNYDISSIVEQLKEKKEWLVNEYPDEFGPERWDFDVDACFSEPFDNGHPQKYYAITLDNYFTPSIVSSSKRYYGTLQEIESFIDSLDQDQFSETVNAFRSFKKGKKAVTHHVAYAEKPLLEPVTLISENYQSLKERSWDFINIWDCIYTMKLHTVFMDILLIKDGDEYIRCIKPKIYGFCYHSNAHAEDHWEPVHNAWGHPGIVLFDDRKEPTVLTSLFLPEKKFSDVKAGVDALYSEDISLDCLRGHLRRWMIIDWRTQMNEFKYLQPLDQMERISRTVLGDQLDELLEKIDKENIGYVITDEGKDDLVLCPAQWFSFVFDDDFGCIVNSALRYSIGRHTYMPSVLMGFVRRYLDVMDTRTISVMIEDIERELPDEKLDYREDWRKLRDDLKVHYQKMLQADASQATAEKENNG